MPALRARRALHQGWQMLRQQPRLLLGFSALACGLQGLGWQLFALGHRAESGVQALLLHGLGVALHLGSLCWLVDGLTRAGLSLSAGRRSSWRRIGHWHGARSWWLSLGLFNAGLSAAVCALAGFITGSLLLQLIEALGLGAALGQQTLLNLLPYPCSLLGALIALLSQLFNPALVIAERLSPSRAYHEGWRLLNRHWPGLLRLLPLLAAILLSPFVLLLVLQAALTIAGLPLASPLIFAVFWAAMVAALPLLSCSVAAAFRQLRPGVR
jgi:hypothetical protein